MTRRPDPDGAASCRGCPWRAGVWRDLGCKAG
jgi:hypothetical protein